MDFLSLFSLKELSFLFFVLVLLLIEMIYWLRIFGRVAFYKIRSHTITSKQPPVSIILSARNEYDMLKKNLPLLLTQDYPRYEIIVINDCSEDDSELLLADMHKAYRNLIFRNIGKDEVYVHNTKMALGLGIKAARYDLLFFIDADCQPSGTMWLNSMQQYFTNGKEIIIGYTRLSYSAMWIRADHFIRTLHYMGKALLNKAYMGLHSNLAYKRELFFNNKGFDVRVTGDMREDIVFINKIATRTNTAVALGAQTATTSILRYTATIWKRLRANELRSFRLCEHGSQYPAFAEAICRLLFFASIASATVVFATNYIVLLSLLGAVLMRFATITVIFVRSQRRLGEKRLLWMLWIWDFLSPLFYFILILSITFKCKRTWR